MSQTGYDTHYSTTITGLHISYLSQWVVQTLALPRIQLSYQGSEILAVVDQSEHGTAATSWHQSAHRRKEKSC